MISSASAVALAVEPASSDDVSLDVRSSFEDCGVSRETWDRHVHEVGAGLYATYDWCRIWWKHYGTGRKLRLYVFRDDAGRLVGIAPMFVETIGAWPLRIRIAKRVGSDFALTVFSLPIAETYAQPVCRALMAELIRSERCDAISFGPILAAEPQLSALREARASLGPELAIVRDEPAGVLNVFHLPATMDQYAKSISKKWFGNYKRRVNLLNQKHRIEREIVTKPAESILAFEHFKAIHAAQWTSKGKLGHFGDWPGSEAFNGDLVSELSRLDRLRLQRILADGAPISSHYSYVFGGLGYGRLAGRSTEPEMEKIGLGAFALVQVIDNMIGEDVRRFEVGVGKYDYKKIYGAEEEDYHAFVVTSTKLFSRLRAKLFLTISDLIHFLYYRVWYLKAAGHLPIKKRPLWTFWARTRL